MTRKDTHSSIAIIGLILAGAVFAACVDDPGDPAAPGGSTSPPSSSSSSPPTSSGSPSSPSAGIPSSCNGDEGGPVPTNAKDLNAWLQKRAYKCWAHESAPHDSAGPHGGMVQTYLNGALEASLAQTGEHPEGAVAVKELFGRDPSQGVTGWAVGVKTQPSSAGGDNWFWYEVFTVAPSDTAPYAKLGETICKNCHAGSDRDFVLTTFPLR